MNPFAIFRPGRFTAMSGEALSFGIDDLKSTAAAYDPAVHEAPIVVGHPETDAPAYGWVKELDFAGGTLSATPRDVEPAFAELVKAGRFKKVSASFYKPGTDANPAPDGYYLRHIGFLGATPPAVKGLKPITFAEDGDDTVTIELSEIADFAFHIEGRTTAGLFRRMREFLIAKFGIEDADKVLPNFEIELIHDQASRAEDTASLSEDHQPEPKEDLMDPEKTAEKIAAAAAADAEKQAAELAEGKEALATAESALAARQAAIDLSEAEAAIDRYVEEGRLPPGLKTEIAAFAASLGDDDEAVEFSEDGKTRKTSQSAAFVKLLDALPKQIDFTELSAEGDGDVDTGDPVAVGHAAAAYAEEQRAKGIDISVPAAVRHVTGAAA